MINVAGRMATAVGSALDPPAEGKIMLATPAREFGLDGPLR